MSRYWIHSAPEGYTDPEHDQSVPDHATETTDRDGNPHAATPAGDVIALCPGRHPAPTRGQPVWCRGCAARIEKDLHALPDLVARLAPGPLNSPRDVTGRHGTGAAAPSPSPAWDEADKTIRTLLHLEDVLRAHLAHAPAGRVVAIRCGDRALGATRDRHLVDACTYLAAQVTPLLSSPWAVAHGRTVLALTRRLTIATGTDRLTHRLRGQCMVCERRGRLHRVDGDELVKCGACGATWPWEHYDRLVNGLAHAERRAGRVAS